MRVADIQHNIQHCHSRGSAQRGQTLSHAAAEQNLLGAGERVEQAAVDVAVQALEIGAACIAEAAGQSEGQAHGVDERIGATVLRLSVRLA